MASDKTLGSLKPAAYNPRKITAIDLCIKSPKPGQKTGVCCVCGKNTDNGYDIPFSDNFTGYSFLTHGDCACPHCYTFFKTPEFRRYSWVATTDEVRFLKRSEIGNIILNPPKPPFFLYITQTGQRQGWLSAFKFISYSEERFFIATDWVGTIFADINNIRNMYKLIRVLREMKVSKTALRTGEYTMFQYRDAIEKGYDNLIDDTKKHIKDPLWEVMIYVAD